MHKAISPFAIAIAALAAPAASRADDSALAFYFLVASFSAKRALVSMFRRP